MGWFLLSSDRALLLNVDRKFDALAAALVDHNGQPRASAADDDGKFHPLTCWHHHHHIFLHDSIITNHDHDDHSSLFIWAGRLVCCTLSKSTLGSCPSLPPSSPPSSSSSSSNQSPVFFYQSIIVLSDLHNADVEVHHKRMNLPCLPVLPEPSGDVEQDRLKEIFYSFSAISQASGTKSKIIHGCHVFDMWYTIYYTCLYVFGGKDNSSVKGNFSKFVS